MQQPATLPAPARQHGAVEERRGPRAALPQGVLVTPQGEVITATGRTVKAEFSTPSNTYFLVCPPLSAAKTMRVFSAMPASSRAAVTFPIWWR